MVYYTYTIYTHMMFLFTYFLTISGKYLKIFEKHCRI